MSRQIYISDSGVSLAEYIASEDDADCYNCWRDDETQKGYNYRFSKTFEEFAERQVKHRFMATILRCSDNLCIGVIFVSAEDSPPDLAIMIYKPYRSAGYGTSAFLLGVRYCFESLKLDKIYAGCYPDNLRSMKMLEKCGFLPHPEGNLIEKHYLTGEEIIQKDFVKFNILIIRSDLLET
jgi:RimJ/RimL family protein N-acetyltransferase